MTNTQLQMHAAEIAIDTDLVQRLLKEQFMRLVRKQRHILETSGTVNAICRLDDDLYVRLPRTAAWSANIDREARWLVKLAPQLSLEVPKLYSLGTPTEAFPHPWAIYFWIEGQPYAAGIVENEIQMARDLANFVQELRAIDVELPDAPPAGRKPLAELDEMTRNAIDASAEFLDPAQLHAVWDALSTAPRWDGTPVWMHGDLLPANLIIREDKLAAVIDFGGTGIGDPAMDVVPAWSVFGAAARAVYREALAVEDGTWQRAKAYALHQALIGIPYYAETNPEFVKMALRTVNEILSEETKG